MCPLYLGDHFWPHQMPLGNMTLELNVFHLSNKHEPSEEQEPEEVCLIGTGEGTLCSETARGVDGEYRGVR